MSEESDYLRNFTYDDFMHILENPGYGITQGQLKNVCYLLSHL